MKIGILSFEYPPHTGFGGIGTYSFYQANALRRLGHEVHVISGWTKPRALFREDVAGVAVWRGQSSVRPAILGRAMDKLKLFWSKNRLETALGMYAALRHVHAAHKLDVIEMPECGAEGLLLNHLVDVPAMIRFHSPARLIMGHYDTKWADRQLCAGLERVAMAGADGFTSCSAFLAEEVKRHVGRASWPIKTIHNGIDLAMFDSAPAVAFDLRAHVGVAADTQVILFCGRLERRKGVHLLADVLGPVLAQSPNTVAVLAGNDLFGTAANEVLPAIARQGLEGRVRLAGSLNSGQVRAALAQSQVFFMPSQWEACPYAALEAMAARRPIVASDAGGLPELLTDGVDGVVVSKEDVAGYQRGLLRLLNDPAQAAQFGAAARQTVAERFSDEVIARHTVDAYRSLCR